MSHEAWQLNQVNPEQFIDIRLTAGAIDNGYLSIPKNCDIFESEHYGGNDAATAGRKFRLSLPNGTEVETDIRANGEEKGAGRLRSRFNALFRQLGLVVGTVVRLKRVERDHYEMLVLDKQHDIPKILINEELLAMAVESSIRPILLHEGALSDVKNEGYHHHKILPRATPLLSRESISRDPIAALKGAVSASVNLLSQFETIKAIKFLKNCSPTEAQTSALELLYGPGDLDSRVTSFLDWAGVAKREGEKDPIGFNGSFEFRVG